MQIKKKSFAFSAQLHSAYFRSEQSSVERKRILGDSNVRLASSQFLFLFSRGHVKKNF